MDRPTIDVYESRAAEYEARRPPRHHARAEAFAARVLAGHPPVDLGCGPGGYLGAVGPGALGLDAAWAMLDIARRRVPRAPLVQADLEAPPFRRGSLGGAWARNSYVHLPRVRLPLALARLHQALALGAPATLTALVGDDEGDRPGDDIPGRFFSRWPPERFADVVAGAGFELDAVEVVADAVWVEARRARMLPDFVGPDMRVLVCGLNPSVVAADAGYGYAGPSNRFWPAALAAGLVTRARDPIGVVTVDRVGMTDLVKRATPRADVIAAEEYRAGAERVRRLVGWLRPRLVLFVGLAGWRAAVDRRARAGLQPEPFGGVPAYVMPSTSGLNAHTRPAEFADHVRAALAAAAEETP